MYWVQQLLFSRQEAKQPNQDKWVCLFWRDLVTTTADIILTMEVLKLSNVPTWFQLGSYSSKLIRMAFSISQYMCTHGSDRLELISWFFSVIWIRQCGTPPSLPCSMPGIAGAHPLLAGDTMWQSRSVMCTHMHNWLCVSNLSKLALWLVFPLIFNCHIANNIMRWCVWPIVLVVWFDAYNKSTEINNKIPHFTLPCPQKE